MGARCAVGAAAAQAPPTPGPGSQEEADAGGAVGGDDADDDGPGGGGSGGGRGGGPSDRPFAQPHRHARTGARLPNPLKPTIEELTPQQIAKARMVKASRIAYEEDFAAAQQYLDDHGVPFDIDESLSSKQSLVLTGDDGAIVAYRGTKIQRHQDVTADAAVVAGVEAHHPQVKNADQHRRPVTEKYGAPSELVAFSLGGAKAIALGSKHGIDTTSFNPLVGRAAFSSKSSEATHSIIRTTEDPISLGVGVARGRSDFKVQSILPHEDKLNQIGRAHV